MKCSLNERAALLKYGYCMTYSKGKLEETFVGECQYFEIQGHNLSDTPGYITLPGSISELNEYMCGPMNGHKQVKGWFVVNVLKSSVLRLHL